MSQEHLNPHQLQDPPRSAPRAGRNLPAAIGVGLALVLAVIGTLGWWHWGFTLLVAAALSLGAVELHKALQRVGMESSPVPIVLGTIAIQIGSYFASQHPERGISAITVLVSMLSLTVLAALMWRLPKGPEGFVKDASASLFTIAYLPLLGTAVPLMLGGDHGRERVITFIACVVMNDTGGYIAGVLFGKHKMAPTISPKKTWEGFIGSIIGGCLAGIVCVMWLLDSPWWVGLLLGVFMVIFGTAGDLVESMIKRDVGIKDMSSFLPGHGGVMDRLDSLLVAAPVAWLILYLTVPGG